MLAVRACCDDGQRSPRKRAETTRDLFNAPIGDSSDLLHNNTLLLQLQFRDQTFGYLLPFQTNHFIPVSFLTSYIQSSDQAETMSRSLSICTVLLAASSESFTLSTRTFARSNSLSLSAKPKIFIDGEAGTTGLQVRGRIESRDDLEIISPPSELRKDDATRKQFINEADVVIMCTFSFYRDS